MEASGFRPEMSRSSEKIPFSEVQHPAVTTLATSGHQPQGELEEVSSEVTWPGEKVNTGRFCDLSKDTQPVHGGSWTGI